mmetsp:Transcript_17768/g.50840  ORF Transcript_17768/g.50840 Transcript_17768/m.50840 type:complete len:333 (-) Transcript_17768:179-1177(-)
MVLVPRIAKDEEAGIPPFGRDPHGHEEKGKGPHDAEQQRPRCRRLRPAPRHVIGDLGRDVGDLVQILRHRLLHVVQRAGLLPQRRVHPHRRRLHLRRHLGDLRLEHLGLLPLELLVLFVGGSAAAAGVLMSAGSGTLSALRWLLLLIVAVIVIITHAEGIIINCSIAIDVIGTTSISSILLVLIFLLLLLGRQEQLVDDVPLGSLPEGSVIIIAIFTHITHTTIIGNSSSCLRPLPPPSLEQILPRQSAGLLRLRRQGLHQPVLRHAPTDVLPPQLLHLGHSPVVVDGAMFRLGRGGELSELIDSVLPQLRDGGVQMGQEGSGEGDPIGEDV